MTRSSERQFRASAGWWNWHNQRNRIDHSDVARWRRMVSWRRAI